MVWINVDVNLVVCRVDMSSIHLRNALSMLEELLQRNDINGDVKSTLQQVRKEIVEAQDEALWARGRAKEAFHVLEELLELLGAEARSGKVYLSRDLQTRQVEISPYVEAVVREDGRVKIEKVATVPTSH
ncbi:MAG: hypothetical protein NZ954_02970 [Thermofilaceae archaeon]|nr:hypothetical protein [Thermofilaceae archaeon]MDW8004499.1 hypothetical protein [Thermofilaceae archaeon]